jgi:YD repeat-containing protein
MFKKLFTKSLLSVALTASILVGCNKDDDPKTKQCQFTSFVRTNSNGTYTFTFTYDGAKVTKITRTEVSGANSDQSVATLTYDSKGNVSEINDSDGTRTVYTYTNDQVTKEEDFEGTVLIDRNDYEYSNGQLVKSQSYRETSTPGTLVKDYYEVLEYASTSSKNPIREKSFSATGSSPYRTAEITYDDKKHYFYGIPAALLKLTILDGRGSENNVTKETYSATENSTYTYEYNTDGYPTKSTEINTYNNQIDSQATSTYTYNCN